MLIPDVINTLLMGLIFMVVIVTIVRPFVLNLVGQFQFDTDIQKSALAEVEREVLRQGELFEAQRADKIKYQRLLLEKPHKPSPKSVMESESIAQAHPEAMSDVTGTSVDGATYQTSEKEGTAETSVETASVEEKLAEGEIEIREGETLAEIKERIRKEQQKAKKPTIPPELLNTANSYEDKVGVVRMVVQTDQPRVASVIRNMIETT